MSKIIRNNFGTNSFFYDLSTKAEQLVDWFTVDYSSGREYILEFEKEFASLVSDPDIPLEKKYDVIMAAINPVCMYLYSRKADHDLEESINNIAVDSAKILNEYYKFNEPGYIVDYLPLEVLEALAEINPLYKGNYALAKLLKINILSGYSKLYADKTEEHIQERYSDARKLAEGAIDPELIKRIQRTLQGSINEEKEASQQEQESEQPAEDPQPEVLEEIKKEQCDRRGMKFFVFIGSIINKFKKNISLRLDNYGVKLKEFSRHKVDVSLRGNSKPDEKKATTISHKPKPGALENKGKVNIDGMPAGEQDKGSKAPGLENVLNQKEQKPKTGQYDQSKVYDEILKKHQNMGPAEVDPDEGFE